MTTGTAEPGVQEFVEPAPTDVPMASPYKDFDYYRETDESTFGGRESETAELVARIFTNRTLVLYGRSGLGKTSLLLAGVFPALRQRKCRPVYVRILDDPQADLRRAVVRDQKGDAGTETATLAALLQKYPPGFIPVIVLDQFEEFFIRFNAKPRQREAFVREISAVATDPALNVHVVFSLREDYLAAVDDFQRRIPGLFEKAFRLLPLTAYGARQAIVRPLINTGIAFDEELVSQLIGELARFDFDSARLQIACAEVYRCARARAAGDIKLTTRDLKAAGDIDDVFRRYFVRAVDGLPPEHHLLVRTILDALITSERTKRALTFGQLLARSTDRRLSATRGLVFVLRNLVDQRLVRRERRARKHWFELSHECLVPEVERWLRLDRQFFEFLTARESVANSCRGNFWLKNPKILLPKEQLDLVIGPFKEQLRLEAVQLEFLVRSAVYSGADAVRFWFHRLDSAAQGGTVIVDVFESPAGTAWTLKTSRQLLIELFGEADEKVRATAAAAAGLLKDGEGDPAQKARVEDAELVAACSMLASRDPSPEVQRSAARSLARLAMPAHDLTLRERLKQRGERAKVYEMLADSYEDGMRLSTVHFSRWTRFQAWRCYAKRMRERHVEFIRRRGSIGARFGAIAGAFWGLAVFFPGRWLALAMSSPGSTKENSLYEGTLILGVCMAAVGFLLGLFLAKGAAKDAVVRHRERWFAPIAKSPYLFITCVGIVGLIFSSVGNNRPDLLPLLPLLTSTIIAMLAAPLRPAVLGAPTWKWAVVEAFFGCTVVLLLPLAACLALALAAGGSGTDDIFAVVGVISASHIIIVAALGGAARTLPLPGARPAKQPRKGWIIPGSAVLAGLGICFFAEFGANALPFPSWLFPHTLAGNPEQIEVRFPNELEGAKYLRLRSPAAGPALERVTIADRPELYFNEYEPRLSLGITNKPSTGHQDHWDELFMLMPGSRTASLGVDGVEFGTARIAFEPLPLQWPAGAGFPHAQANPELHFLRVPFQAAGKDAWRGAYKESFPADAWKGSIAMDVFALPDLFGVDDTDLKYKINVVSPSRKHAASVSLGGLPSVRLFAPGADLRPLCRITNTSTSQLALEFKIGLSDKNGLTGEAIANAIEQQVAQHLESDKNFIWSANRDATRGGPWLLVAVRFTRRGDSAALWGIVSQIIAESLSSSASELSQNVLLASVVADQAKVDTLRGQLEDYFSISIPKGDIPQLKFGTDLTAYLLRRTEQ